MRNARDGGSVLEVPIIPIADQIILPGAIQLLHIPETHLQDMLHRFSQKRDLVAISVARQLNDKALLGSHIAVLSEIVEVADSDTPGNLAAQGRSRASIIDFTQTHPFAVARVRLIPESWSGAAISREDAKKRLIELLDRWAFLKGSDYPDILNPVRTLPPERICDIFGFYGITNTLQKKQVLELIDGERRFEIIEQILVKEIDRMEKFPSIHHFPTDNTLLH